MDVRFAYPIVAAQAYFQRSFSPRLASLVMPPFGVTPNGVTLVGVILAEVGMNWFPLGLAEGTAFCNRTEEAAYLANNIENTRQTLLSSPRRYGKTSLVSRVVEKTKYPAAEVDLTLVSSLASVRDVVGAAVGQMLLKLQPTHKKALVLAGQFLKRFQPSLTIDAQLGAKIELQFSSKKVEPALEIADLLQGLDAVAVKTNRRAVLFIDEFQQIATLPDNKLLEASIRHAAQKMKRVTIIFSGSNRQLLHEMFEDRSRPLYHLCDRMVLGRIDFAHYEPFLQHAAKDRWNKALSRDIIEQILQRTQCHPYYTNALCGKLWIDAKPPTAEKIEAVWKEYVREECFWVVQALQSLTPQQRTMLIYIAKNELKQPGSQVVLSALQLSASGSVKVLNYLLNADLVYQRKGEKKYSVLDPVMEAYILMG